MKRMKYMKSRHRPNAGFHETTAGRRMKRMKFMKSAGRQTHETHETHEMHEIRRAPKTHETHEIHEIREIRMHTKMQQERFCTHFMKTKSCHILQFGAFLADLISTFGAAPPLDDEWL